MGMYQGVNASEGIGIGTVMVAVDPDLTFEPHAVADSAAEKERYQTALSVFCEKTQAQADHMKETVGEAEAEIMSGHIVLAQDPGMTDAINAAIDGGTCAEQALMDTSTMFENMFLSMDDEMFRLRAADIADIRTGILAELLGKEVVDLSVLPENTVVVVHDLTPSMTATIDKAHVAGIVTETGGRTSHSAIIARALEIPAVLSVAIPLQRNLHVPAPRCCPRHPTSPSRSPVRERGLGIPPAPPVRECPANRQIGLCNPPHSPCASQ